MVLLVMGIGISIGSRGSAQATGTIRGFVRIASAPSAPGVLKVTTDQKVCGETVPDESLVVGASGGVVNAVVTVRGAKASRSVAASTVTNRGCRFVPHVQVVAPRSTLVIQSDDKTLHTSHGYLGEQESLFNVAIPIPGLTVKRPLVLEGVVRLVCDTHPWMRGYIVVTNETAAVTGPDGTFVIEGVPPGPREVRVWHERLGPASQKVEVPAGGAADVTVTLIESPLNDYRRRR